MGQHWYLVLPSEKSVYDVMHVKDGAEAGAKFNELRDLAETIEETQPLLDEEAEKPLSKYSARAFSKLVAISEKAARFSSDLDLEDLLFVALMKRYHPDAYILNEYEDKLDELRSEGYKVNSVK